MANLLSLRIFGASNRAVVQLGRTLEWGSRGRGFESRRPDVTKFLAMFHVYVLRSSKTGRRYVGSCEDLDQRLGATISLIPKLRVTASRRL